jgi:DUF4097 and DUF4098 domain-containing protein YvlB
VGDPLVIRVAGRSSRIKVSAVADAELQVDGGRVRQHADGSIEVSSSTSSEIEIVCPEHSSVTVSTASGRVSVRGIFASVHVVAASGRVEIDHAAEIEVRTSSARVEIGECQRLCRVTTTSGRISVGVSGDVELSSTSGRVTVGEADRAKVRTVTGRIELGASQAADVHAHTVSGRVEVRLAGQAPARMQLKSWTGRIERRVPDGDGGANVEVNTTSGSIVVEHR